MSDYDVIVIGSRRRRRHARPPPGAVGQADPAARARRLAAREPQNWLAQDVFVDGRYVSPDTWYYADLTPFAPQVHYYVGGATKLYGAALYRLRERGLRRAPAPRRDLAGVADLLRGHGAVLHARRSSCTRSTAPAARIRPTRRRALRTRSPRSRTSRGSSSCPTTSPRRACTRSTRRAGSCSTRATCPTASACAVRTATASRASCTPSRTPR